MLLTGYLRLLHDLKESEGLRLLEYRDTVGKRTIGYGYNVDGRGEAEFRQILGRPYDGTVTHYEAVLLLEAALAKTEAELLARLPYWIVILSDVQDARYRVLLDMAYNMGVPKLLTFKVTLAAVRDKQYELAASNMLKSKWARQVGDRAVRLSEQMRKGSV